MNVNALRLHNKFCHIQYHSSWWTSEFLLEPNYGNRTRNVSVCGQKSFVCTLTRKRVRRHNDIVLDRTPPPNTHTHTRILGKQACRRDTER